MGLEEFGVTDVKKKIFIYSEAGSVDIYVPNVKWFNEMDTFLGIFSRYTEAYRGELLSIFISIFFKIWRTIWSVL